MEKKKTSNAADKHDGEKITKIVLQNDEKETRVSLQLLLLSTIVSSLTKYMGPVCNALIAICACLYNLEINLLFDGQEKTFLEGMDFFSDKPNQVYIKASYICGEKS